MGSKMTDDRYSEQATKRMRVKGCNRITRCAGRLPLIAASIALLPALAGCSSSSPSSSHYVADVYPSKPLVDLLFEDSLDSPPPVRTAGPPAQPNSSTAVADAAVANGPGTAAPSGSATAAAAVPAPSSPSKEFDPVAAAYPSVPLFDYLSGSTKSSRH